MMIASIQNKAVKRIVQLQEKSRTRRKEAVFVVEGLREISLAVSANYSFEQIYYCPKFCSEKILIQLGFPENSCTMVSEEVYQKIAYRNTTEGIVGIAQGKSHALSSVLLNENPLILVAEAPEKPGNIGALLRTADAAKLDAVLIANPKTDLYNPNIIRSSVGCVFTNQIATGTTSEIITFLKSKRLNIYAAILQEASVYTAQDFTQPTAIVVGTEAEGLSKAWRENSTQNIIIPMQGKIDSMNVSVAAGILIFEAKRQRTK